MKLEVLISLNLKINVNYISYIYLIKENIHIF